MSSATGARALTVLLVTDVYPPDSGGSGWSTHALAEALREAGHAVEVLEVSTQPPASGGRIFEGVRVGSIDVSAARRAPSRWLGGPDHSFAAVRAAVRTRLAQAPAVDIVHGQHLHSGPGAMAAARQARVGAVVTLRDYWPVCVHGTDWWGGSVCGGCTPANLSGCLHEYLSVPRPVGGVLGPLVRRRLHARAGALRDAHCVTAVSEDLANRVRQRLPDAAVWTVPNMVDARRSARLAGEGQPRAPLPERFLLAAGKLNATKGFVTLVHDLADAGCRLPLLIAGRGPEQARVVEVAGARGLQVMMLGWVGGAELLALAARAWAVVVPSLWNDPLPRVILESLSLGTPVIARRAGGSPEAFTHGEGGWLYDDAAGLAAALAALQSPPARATASAHARDTAAARFAPGIVLPRLLRVYEAAQVAAAAT